MMATEQNADTGSNDIAREWFQKGYSTGFAVGEAHVYRKMAERQGWWAGPSEPPTAQTVPIRDPYEAARDQSGSFGKANNG